MEYRLDKNRLLDIMGEWNRFLQFDIFRGNYIHTTVLPASPLERGLYERQ